MKKQNVLALIIAYYLSRFDAKAYEDLGFDTQIQAHREIGNQLGVNPNTIKNMRDEFDSIHDNSRVGWYQRDIRPSRKKVVESFQELSETELREVVLNIISASDIEEQAITTIAQDIDRHIGEKQKERLYIVRGRTGRKAEEVFISGVKESGQPFSGDLIDTRDLGTGYDFEVITSKEKKYVEVKGLESESGGILITEKEWETARRLGKSYYFVIVRNINHSPDIHVVQDPASNLNAKSHLYTTVRVRWTVSEKELSRIQNSD